MNMNKFFVLIAIFLVTLSCATLPSNNIPHEIDTYSSDGMIVGTMSFKNEKPIFNGYLYFYTGENIDRFYGQKAVRVNPAQTIKMKFRPDFFDQEKAVYFFSIKERYGKYQFSIFRLFSNTSYSNSLLDIPIEIDFNIEKGKVKYFGELYFDYRNRTLTFSDQSSRDIPLLQSKYPHLKIEEE